MYAYQHPAANIPATNVTATNTPTPTPTKKVEVSGTIKPTATSTPAETINPTQTSIPTPTDVIMPIQTTIISTPAPTQSLHVAITQSAGSVGQGNYATEGISTQAGAYCTIEVDYASGASQAQGLNPQTADGDGNASWIWKVGTRTTLGSWPIYISCSFNGASAQVSDTVNVINQ